MDQPNVVTKPGEPWNQGKLVGQKAPFKLKEIWAIRIRLQLANCARDLALFDLAIDSKLRACDLVRLRVRDVSHGDRVAARTIVMQQKTQRPVQFEITEQSREAVARWIDHAKLQSEDFLFPSRLHNSAHLSTRQYARIVDGWVQVIGLDPAAYGTHTLRRTKASLIYRRTKNLRAVQLLLGHAKLESTVRYLGLKWTTPWKWPSKRKCSDWRQGRPSFQAVASRPEAVIRAALTYRITCRRKRAKLAVAGQVHADVMRHFAGARASVPVHLDAALSRSSKQSMKARSAG